MWELIGLVAAASTLHLSEIREMDVIRPNCDPQMKFINLNAELINLVAVFRHGDRAPLKIKNEFWRNKTCVECEDKCNTIKCEDGMVTMKGFSQSQRLGKFIKDFYIPRFRKLEKVEAFKTTLDRTYTTLRGVFDGLDMSNIPVQTEEALVHSSFSNAIKKYFLKELKSKTHKKTTFDYYKFDEIVTSYCSKTPISCENSVCDREYLLDIYNDHLKAFINVSALSKDHFITSGVSLGDLGHFIKREVKKENTLSLVSSHDSTLIKLLQGLNVTLDSVPPYSSVVFIEIWKDAKNKKFVRVIYEGKVLKIGLYKEKFVNLKNFIDYLDMYNIPNAQVKDIEIDFNSELDTKQDLEEAADATKDAYKPIIKEIKKDPILKNHKKFSSSFIEPLQILKNGFSFLRSALREYSPDKKQYLFGWFKSKSDEEMITIKQNVENDKGEIEIHTIECPKSGKGNCKTISKQKVESKNAEQKSPIKKVDKENFGPTCAANESKPCNSCEAKPKPCEIKKPKTVCEANEEEPIEKSCCESKPKSSCSKKELPSDCSSKKSCDLDPIPTSFNGLPGTETTFKTQGCSIVGKSEPVSTSCGEPKPSPCSNFPSVLPLRENPMPCMKPLNSSPCLDNTGISF